MSENTTPPPSGKGDPSEVSVDILVNDEGVACLVTDRKPAKDIESVAFHRATSRLAILFKDSTKFPMEHKILPEIGERLLKVKDISIIVLTDGQPSWHIQVPFKLL